MATAKRKTQQEATAPEEPGKIRSRAISESKLEQEQAEPEELSESVRKDQPAITINIQAWATPIVGLIMLVIGLLGGFYIRPWILAQSSSTTTTSNTTSPVVIPTVDQTASQQKLMESLIPKVRHFKGDPNAPVTIIEFGDFQCPYCGRFAATTEAQIEEQYIQSGKARFGYWNFAFLGSESNWAAEAAECAADQDKFWEYHDILYSSQSGENQGTFNKDKLKKFADDLGLDTSVFNECFDSGKYSELIQEDSNTASSIGVRSTPTFLINGQPMVGAQPFEIFQQTIDSILK